MGLLRLVFGTWVAGVAWLVALAVAARILARALTTVLRADLGPLVGGASRQQERPLSSIVAASALWGLAVLGAAFPLSLTSLPAFQSWPAASAATAIRRVFLLAVILIPLAVGFASQALLSPPRRASGAARLAAGILQGYRYTVGLALALLAAVVGTPAARIRAVVKRWGRRAVTVRIAVVPEDALGVVDDIQRALEAGGVETTRAAPHWWLRLPSILLRRVAGGVFETLASGPVAALVSHQIEIVVFPTALSVSGRPRDVARAQASLAEHLPFSRVSMSWSPQGRRLEDQLRAIWADLAGRSAGPVGAPTLEHLREVERDVHAAPLSYDEWDVLFRELLLVERRLLAFAAPGRASVTEATSLGGRSHNAGSRLPAPLR